MRARWRRAANGSSGSATTDLIVSRGAARLVAYFAALLCIAVPLLLALIAAALGGVTTALSFEPPGSPAGPSKLALGDIPAEYLALYERAAARYRIDWAILAAVGKVECDHGRDPDPSCTREGAVNAAGAGGPMQFLAGTWARYGIDGNGDGRIDRWNPADAIFSAANYLRASGAPRDNRAALLTYNHAGWYADEVESWAARYRARSADAESPSPGAGGGYVPGARAVLSPGDGHVALIPTGAPAAVQAMIVAGNELQSLPYGPGGHPDPRGASEEDCSSTVNYVLYRAGVRPIAEILRENPLAQSYVTWGEPGEGRWVTIYAADAPTPHVFIVIAGLRLDTSHDGTDVGPNRSEDGPRWRIDAEIPRWARWSVRHPPGL